MASSQRLYSNNISGFFGFELISDNFPFTNRSIPFVRKVSWRKGTWEHKITQKRFIELFNSLEVPKQISIVDGEDVKTYFVGAGLVFRFGNFDSPIICKTNTDLRIIKDLTPLELKIVKKLNQEYVVKEFIFEDLVDHHTFRFKTLKDKHDYLNITKQNLKTYLQEIL